MAVNGTKLPAEDDQPSGVSLKGTAVYRKATTGDWKCRISTLNDHA
jgi:ketosteroid isomerase-like protein